MRGCGRRASFFENFPYVICEEGSLRGRHPLRISCTLKIVTMKARVEVRRDSFASACNVRHGAPCSINRYTHIHNIIHHGKWQQKRLPASCNSRRLSVDRHIRYFDRWIAAQKLILRKSVDCSAEVNIAQPMCISCVEYQHQCLAYFVH